MIEPAISTPWDEHLRLSHFPRLLAGLSSKGGCDGGVGEGSHTNDCVQGIGKLPWQTLRKTCSWTVLVGGGSPNISSTRRKPVLGALLCIWSQLLDLTLALFLVLHPAPTHVRLILKASSQNLPSFSCLLHPRSPWICASQICLWEELLLALIKFMNRWVPLQACWIGIVKGRLSGMIVFKRTQGDAYQASGRIREKSHCVCSCLGRGKSFSQFPAPASSLNSSWSGAIKMVGQTTPLPHGFLSSELVTCFSG